MSTKSNIFTRTPINSDLFSKQQTENNKFTEMIVLNVEVEPGFRKANANNIPLVRSETIFSFVTQLATKQANSEIPRQSQEVDLRVDYVQVRKIAEMCDVRAVVFPAVAGGTSDAHVRVAIKVNTKRDEIVQIECEQCPQKESCSHSLAFIFWLHRKSTDTETPAIRDYWGVETETLADEERSEALRIRDIIVTDELRMDADMSVGRVSEDMGLSFLDAVLDEIDLTGQRDTAFYRHFRPSPDEFEPLFIHHTLLNASKNGVRSTHAFTRHMEDQAKEGLFVRLADVSKSCYKSPLWLEAQYMRLRCSLIHRIASRKYATDDESIFDAMLCKEREYTIEERQQMKLHKRFILKQTEKLENKMYEECGLILSESYPYICAAPDGITDDHIVEIKAPKTDEEFEKYLEGRETIAPKYMAQIQIQMYMANVPKALYCVLSPTFDTNGALHYVWVQADMEFVASLLQAAEDFWKEIVFPRLSKIYCTTA